MFDTYSNPRVNCPQTVNINAVSGAIVKNYKESFMVSFEFNSEMANNILDKEPKMVKRLENTSSYYNPINKIYEPIVVLQIILCGDNRVIAEVMWKEDFDKMYESEGNNGD